MNTTNRRNRNRNRFNGTNLPDYIWERASYLAAVNNGPIERERQIRNGNIIPEGTPSPLMKVGTEWVIGT